MWYSHIPYCSYQIHTINTIPLLLVKSPHIVSISMFKYTLQLVLVGQEIKWLHRCQGRSQESFPNINVASNTLGYQASLDDWIQYHSWASWHPTLDIMIMIVYGGFLKYHGNPKSSNIRAFCGAFWYWNSWWIGDPTISGNHHIWNDTWYHSFGYK